MQDTQEYTAPQIPLATENKPITSQVPKRIDAQDNRFKAYFDSRSEGHSAQKIAFSNLILLNKDGTFLYDSEPSSPSGSLHHALWLKDSANISSLHPIDQNEWSELRQKPELIEKTTQLIMECFVEAQRFYPWEQHIDGFTLEGKAPFGMESGNVLGIRISSSDWKPLMLAVESNDTGAIESIKKYLAASFVHERTHLERDDGLVSCVTTEIASHIAQYAFDPKNNPIFIEQIDRSLQNIDQQTSAPTESRSLPLYDQASYAALIIITDALTDQDKDLQSLVSAQQDPHKIPFLRQLNLFISESDISYLRESVLPMIIKTDGDTLLKQAKQIEKKWGAVVSLFTE